MLNQYGIKGRGCTSASGENKDTKKKHVFDTQINSLATVTVELRIELSHCFAFRGVIQITLQHDLTHLWVKCDTTALTAAHYFIILTSCPVAVYQ